MDIGIGHIVGGMHTAISLIDILNFKSVIAALPIAHQFSGVVRRAVVHDQPDEILAALAAKAFIGTRQRMRPIVGRGKNG